MLINASEDSGIDVLRNKIRQFASSVSLFGNKYKVVILDEADYLNASSTQPALRGFIEEFSDNCRFLLTCNFKNRIIPALHSRCTVIDFQIDKKTLSRLCASFMSRLKFILDEESVKYKNPILAKLILKYAPDWRRILNECQRYSTNGEIGSEILLSLSDESISQLITYLKGKDFRSMRSWVTQNSDLDSSVLFRKVYDSLYEFAEPHSIPGIILTIAEYQYRAAFVSDAEINTVACLTEIMSSAKWK